MGRSLATKVAQEGINVYLKEVSPEAVAVAKSELGQSLDHEIAKFGLTNAEKKAIIVADHLGHPLRLRHRL